MGAENAWENVLLEESGAESGAREVRSGAGWRQIRKLIVDCPDLPSETKQRLITEGDATTGGSHQKIHIHQRQ